MSSIEKIRRNEKYLALRIGDDVVEIQHARGDVVEDEVLVGCGVAE